MRAFLILLKYLLAAIVVMTIFGGVGMMIGGVVADVVYPRPNAHIYQGIEFVMGGALLGALLGLIAVVAAAIQEIKKKRRRSIQSEQAS